MYCKKCGANVSENDAFCAKCGYSLPKYERYNKSETSDGAQQQFVRQDSWNQQQQNYNRDDSDISYRSGLVVLLLALFVGPFGIHSFYAGRIGIGVAQLLTLGGCGIWVLVDIIILATGSYRDGDGKLIVLQ